MEIKTTIAKIGGMHCANCAMTVDKSLRSLRGVSDVRVNFADESAVILFDHRKAVFLPGNRSPYCRASGSSG